MVLSLAVMLTINAQLSGAQEIKLTPFTPLQYGGIALVGATALRFFTREGDNTPSRFNWEKIAQGEDLLNQSFYLVDDELIGHVGTKSYDEINKENGRVERVNAHYPKGLGGWTAFYYKTILSALGTTWVVVTAARVAALPDTTPENFIPRLTTEITIQVKNLGMNPALDVFIPTFAVIAGYKFANQSK